MDVAGRQARPEALVDAEVQVHRLHRRTAGPFAEVVHPRDQHDLVVAAEDEEVDPVGVVAGLHVEVGLFQRLGVVERHDPHEALARRSAAASAWCTCAARTRPP